MPQRLRPLSVQALQRLKQRLQLVRRARRSLGLQQARLVRQCMAVATDGVGLPRLQKQQHWLRLLPVIWSPRQVR
jgi:hypothetical protein